MVLGTVRLGLCSCGLAPPQQRHQRAARLWWESRGRAAVLPNSRIRVQGPFWVGNSLGQPAGKRTFQIALNVVFTADSE